MDRIETDICVIGAGSGGLSVAAGAVQMGARVVLIEGGEMGGDCLNYGCVPSKALIAAARRAHAMRSSEVFGISPVEPAIDFAAVKDHVRNSIDIIAPVDSQERFEGLGVRVIRAWAKFVSPTEVEAGEFRITARRFVLATGSVPFVPPIPGLADVPFLTNETLFDLRERPDHLIVIGGGPIGMEMAQAHSRLGCRVTVLEGQKALGREDPEAAAVVLRTLRDEGVAIHEDTPVNSVAAHEDRIVAVFEGGQVAGSHLLVAVGRKVSLEKLDLAAAGVAFDKQGVKVDGGLRSSNRRVFAVGDAAGQGQFTHLAGYHAGVVLRSILFGLSARTRTDHIPRATYTDPELAQVGMTESEACERHGNRLEIARFDLKENDRAVTEDATGGGIKVMVVGGKPVGATIVGQNAGDLIGIWALAIANGTKMSAIAGMIAPYPTLGEINKRAAGAYFSPRLFENPTIKRVVRMVQRLLP